MKVDTEGNEYHVLEGATQLLHNNKVDVIQFEFNEMNVISRVFLKDFYDLLPKHTMYRLDTQRLIPLGDYSPLNEVFRIQNIIAIHNDLPQPVPREQ